jgi:hypothetical protein
MRHTGYTIEIFVRAGDAFPRVGGSYASISPMTGIAYIVAVESICALKWTDNGGVQVTVVGRKMATNTPMQMSWEQV